MENLNVVYVCRGNACRSPLGESIMRQLLINNNKEQSATIWSCGTLDWDGERDEDMVYCATILGYELGGHTRHMTRQDLMAADYVIVFDDLILNEVKEVLDADHWSRIHLFNELAYNRATNVQDPRGEPLNVYLNVAQHIEAGCKNIYRRLFTD